MTIRFFILQAHYRSTIDFSNDALQAAEKGFLKLMKSVETLENLYSSTKSTYDVNELEKRCYLAIEDDFNTPILIAHLFDGVRIINSVKDGKESLSDSDFRPPLGFWILKPDFPVSSTKSISKPCARNALPLSRIKANPSC